MQASQWQRIDEIFHRALEVPGPLRSRLISDLANGDTHLQQEVESLVAHYRENEEWLNDATSHRLRESVQEAIRILQSPATISAETVSMSSTSEVNSRKQLLDDAIDSLRDRFVFQTWLGKGGTGTVGRFQDLVLERVVAIKFLHSDSHTIPLASILQESRSIAKLRSDHIVGIHEIIDDVATPGLVMEWIQGPSLRKLILSRKRMVPRFAAEIAKQVAHGLVHAHAAGILHRDIKPSNILLQRKSGKHEAWRAKIIDFGIACSCADSPAPSLQSLRGTPAYMAPELLLDQQPPTVQTDLYALGVTLYEMLVGEPPFRGSVSMIVRQLQSTDPRPLRSIVEEIPKDLESICLKLLSSSPAQRYGSAEELSEDLDRFLKGLPTRARPISLLHRGFKWSKKPPFSHLDGAAMPASVPTLVVGSIDTAATLYRKNDQIIKQQNLAYRALLTRIPVSEPEYLSFAVDEVRTTSSNAISDLRQLWMTQTDPKARLNVACALAILGEPMSDYIVRQVVHSPTRPSQCALIVQALRLHTNDSIQALDEQLAHTFHAKDQAKLAILALHLGNSRPSRQLTDATRDATARTQWIHLLSSWHGNLSELLTMLESQTSRDLAPAIFLGLGLIEPEALTAADRIAIQASANKILQQTPTMAERNAIDWLARKQGISFDETSKTDSHLGLAMVRIPAGHFVMGNDDPELQYEGRMAHPVRLTRDFMIADREIPVGLFQEFLNDPQCSPEQKPKDWQSWKYDEIVSPSSQHPVQQVSWNDAVLFCNWLSRRQSLQEVYNIDPSASEQVESTSSQEPRWIANRSANGYRLPTEAEFEYACRAGTNSKYSFGNERHFLEYYAAWSNNTRIASNPCGTLMPNPWGLFDLHGNVWEWVEDWSRPFPKEEEIDPIGLRADKGTKTFRGGGVFTFSGDPVSSSRGDASPNTRYSNLGFRVARNVE
ncbi:MAG: bifunctional serine/threonine-protein kinase/formylglycine-generating enzyme family protein [Pirellulales bacterium]